MANLVQSTTILPAGSTYTSGWLRISSGVRIVGSVFSDQAGTIYIEQSGDGVSTDVSTSYTVTANQGEGFDEQVLLPYIQIRFTNTGAVSQTAFRLYGNVQASDGSFVQGAQVTGVSDTLYFVGRWNGAQYITVGTFNATGGSDANNQAAVEQGTNGKYISFPVASAIVDNVALTEQANANPTTF